MKKKLFALLLAVVMISSVVALVACNNDKPIDPTVITNGYYAFSYPADGVGTMYRYFHFYEDRGYGAIVYYGAQSGNYGQMGNVCFYKVEKKDYSYAIWDSRSDIVKDESTQVVDTATAVKGTVPYTVTFTSIENNTVLGTCGFDGDNLYLGNPEDIGFVNAGGRTDSHNMKFKHDTTSANTVEPFSKESSQVIATYYKTSKSQLILNHDATYIDTVADESKASKGTFTCANGKYTLSKGGTLEVTASAITYKNGDVTATLTTTKPADVIIPEPAEDIVLTGTHSQGNFPATLTLKDGGVATYVVEMPAAYGGTQTMTGTWTNEKATVKLGDNTVEITLTKTGDVWTGVNADQAISLSSASEEPAPAEDIVLTGTHSLGNFPATLTLKDGGEATYVVEMPATYGGTQTMTGTWTNAKATITVPAAMGGGIIEITLTKSGDVWTGVNADQVISLSSASEEPAPAEDIVLTGTHSQGNFAATLTLKDGGEATYVVEMPATYGGTQTMTGTWTNEKVTITIPAAMGGGTIEITLTKTGDVWTGVNADQAISLSSATAEPVVDIVLTGKHSAGNFAATLTLKDGGEATYVVEMPATYGGTQTMTGTWTNEKATITVPAAMGGGTIEITLTKTGDVWTGVNADQAISLSSASAE